MKLSNLLALAAICVGHVKAQDRTGQEFNADTCEQVDRKDSVGFFESSFEWSYGPLDPSSYAGIPSDCQPENTTSIFGAWYKMEVQGSAGMVLGSAFWTRGLANSPHSVSIVQGNCDDLTCVTKMESAEDGTGALATNLPFSLLANTKYFIFVAVQNNGFASVPRMGMQLTDPESECKLFRSDQIIFDHDSHDSAFTGLGSCTPCESTTTESVTKQAGTTTWTTTCTDACKQCYDASRWGSPGDTFCYTEARKWTKTINPDGTSMDNLAYCYNFTDGSFVCDAGFRDGACPLEIDGTTCESCETQVNATGCVQTTTEPYGLFKANCGNLNDGSGEVDKCLNSGFQATTALTNYGIYTDIALANNFGVGAFVQDFAGECANYEAEGLPVETMAPTPVPDDPITLNIGDETEPFAVTLGQNKIFSIPVSGVSGILTCESFGDNGDVDIYMGKDFIPLGSTNCAGESFNSDETCSVVIDGNTEVFLAVYGYRPATDVVVECGVTDKEDARDIKADVDVDSDIFDLDAGQYRLYKLETPQSVARVTCETNVEDGDLDLFMRSDGMPVPYDESWEGCRAFTFSGREYCELTENISGKKIYILLQGWGNVTDGIFSCEIQLEPCGDCLREDDADTITLGDEARSFNLLENENKLFVVRVPENTREVWCNVAARERPDSDKCPDDPDTNEDPAGDVDLYMRVGNAPVLPGVTLEGGVYDCGSLSPTDKECCKYKWNEDTGAPQSIDVYALVAGYLATKDIRIECNADTPLTKDDADRISFGNTYGTDLAKDEEVAVYYRVDEFVDEVRCWTEARRGDVDLFMKINDLPKRRNGNDQCEAASQGSDEECTITFGGDGAFRDDELYVLLVGFDETRDVALRCEQIIFVDGRRKKLSPDLIYP